MMIVSAKLSKRKILIGLLMAAAVIFLLVLLLGKSGAPAAEEPGLATQAATNEERIAFLQRQEKRTGTMAVPAPETLHDQHKDKRDGDNGQQI